MTIKRTSSSIWGGILWLVLVASCGNSWAASAGCLYPKQGVERNGSGIGGTGTPAKGSGIGGTGSRPDSGKEGLQIAGYVLESKGIVEARLNGFARRLAKNDPVCVGETLTTAKLDSIKIRLTDNGLIEVRPQSKLRIEAYIYGRKNKNTSIVAVFEGSSRFVTGNIGKEYPQNVFVRTPSAIIGVHGTDHEVTVIPPGSDVGDQAGTYDRVNFGVTFIRTENGEIDVHPEEVGFASKVGEPPILLHEIPEFLQATHFMTQGGNMPAEDLHNDHAVRENGHPDLLEHAPSVPEIHDVGHVPELPEITEPPEIPEPPELPDPPELSDRPDD